MSVLYSFIGADLGDLAKIGHRILAWANGDLALAQRARRGQLDADQDSDSLRKAILSQAFETLSSVAKSYLAKVLAAERAPEFPLAAASVVEELILAYSGRSTEEVRGFRSALQGLLETHPDWVSTVIPWIEVLDQVLPDEGSN